MASIEVSNELYEQVKAKATAKGQSIPQLFEDWDFIHSTAEQFPQLAYKDILGMLQGIKEHQNGQTTPYTLDELAQ